MKYLLLDTSTSFGCVAVMQEEKLLAQSAPIPFKSHVEKLFPAVQNVLKEAQLEMRDLQGVGVGLGPGSFTGLRIGIAAALGFSFALKIPIAGTSTLRILAETTRPQTKHVAALIDARRHEVFGAVYDFSQSEQVLVEERALSPEKWAELFIELKSKPLLIGDGAHLVQTELQKNSLSFAEHSQSTQLDALAMSRLILPKLRAGGESRESIVPNYIRQSDAELNYQTKSAL